VSTARRNVLCELQTEGEERRPEEGEKRRTAGSKKGKRKKKGNYLFKTPPQEKPKLPGFVSEMVEGWESRNYEKAPVPLEYKRINVVDSFLRNFQRVSYPKKYSAEKTGKGD